MVLDPLSVVGLTGNIICFIAVGLKVLSKAEEIRDSAKGATLENADVETVAKSFRAACNDLTSSNSSKDDELDKLCQSCKQVASELLDMLDLVKVGAHAGRRESLKKAIKLLWKKDDINSLKDRLASFRQQLTIYVVSDLRNRIDLQAVQKSEEFKALDLKSSLRASAILSALKESDHVFEACLKAQSDYLEALHNKTVDLILSESTKTRESLHEIQSRTDELWVEIDLGFNQLEDQIQRENAMTRSEIVQDREATNRMLEQILEMVAELKKNKEAINQQYLATVKAFVRSTSVTMKRKLQEQSAALASALIRLQTVYESLLELLSAIRSKTMNLVIEPTLDLFEGRSVRSNSSSPSPSIGSPTVGMSESAEDSALELVASMQEAGIMRMYYSYYYHGLSISQDQAPTWSTFANRWSLSHAMTRVDGNVAALDPQLPALIILANFKPTSTYGRRFEHENLHIWKLIAFTAILDRMVASDAVKFQFMSDLCAQSRLRLNGYSTLTLESSSTLQPERFYPCRSQSYSRESSVGKRLEQDMAAWLSLARFCGLRQELNAIGEYPVHPHESSQELESKRESLFRDIQALANGTFFASASTPDPIVKVAAFLSPIGVRKDDIPAPAAESPQNGQSPRPSVLFPVDSGRKRLYVCSGRH